MAEGRQDLRASAHATILSQWGKLFIALFFAIAGYMNQPTDPGTSANCYVAAGVFVLLAVLHVLLNRAKLEDGAIRASSGLLPIAFRTIPLGSVQYFNTHFGLIGGLVGYGTMEIRLKDGKRFRVRNLWKPMRFERIAYAAKGGRKMPTGAPRGNRAS
ncbi:MAG: PH domain-containing protein [Sutterellaceae bacterium]|nr:PH domain-containing protein [Sutterellaceae bacterium]MDD7442327.1 PH domain-containing protein [Sutterellaceae bacterium]MDY2868379.1 PH domain-containing protein [Mesosutterella sp.]